MQNIDLYSKSRFLVRSWISTGSKIRSGSASRPARACRRGFPFAVSQPCAAPYLTHHPFLKVISLREAICRYPAIADARKVEVFGAPEIEMGSKMAPKMHQHILEI